MPITAHEYKSPKIAQKEKKPFFTIKDKSIYAMLLRKFEHYCFLHSENVNECYKQKF